MNFAAVIIVVAALILGAAAPFAIAWGIERWWRRLPFPAYWAAIVGGVLGLVAGFGVTNDWFTGALWNERVPVAKVLPYMSEIRARDFSLYERLETSILRDQQDGKSAEEVSANAKRLVMSYVADKTAFLPDDLTVELYATTRDMFAHLASQKEFEACAGFALGRLKESDIEAKLSPELVERNTANTLRVLATKRVEDAPRMGREQFSLFTAQAFGDASQATGIPPEDVDELLGGRGEAGKTCRIVATRSDRGRGAQNAFTRRAALV
jgi:hypothetical protein